MGEKLLRPIWPCVKELGSRSHKKQMEHILLHSTALL